MSFMHADERSDRVHRGACVRLQRTLTRPKLSPAVEAERRRPGARDDALLRADAIAEHQPQPASLLSRRQSVNAIGAGAPETAAA